MILAGFTARELNEVYTMGEMKEEMKNMDHDDIFNAKKMK